MQRSTSFAFGLGFAAFLVAGTAMADRVLLLPAEGTDPGKALTATLAQETRLAIVELGHSVVADAEVAEVMGHVSDGRADNADEFASMAGSTSSDWIVVPVIHTDTAAYRLEMTAYQASSGRTESVSRDIDAQQMHPQVVEMARVLLRPEGVGVGALPWETTGPPPPMSAPGAQPSTPAPTGQPPVSSPAPVASGSTGLRPLAGVTLGVASALSRPEGATGSSTALHGGIRAGLELDSPVELALDLRGNIAGPKATTVDVSARYWLNVTDTVRVAPEVAPGLFLMGGGSQDTSFLLRFTAVGSVEVSEEVSVEAHAGDVTWVPASGWTVVLGGATVGAVARF